MSREKPNTYTAEFRGSAVKLANESDQPAVQVAKELGINVNTPHTWIAKYSKAKPTDKPGRTDGHLYDELKRLRKDVVRLTEERDLLKKAAAYLCPVGTLPRSNGDATTRVDHGQRWGANSRRFRRRRSSCREVRLDKKHAADSCVNRACRLLDVTRSAYYAWLRRSPTTTGKADQALTAIIASAFKKSRETYGPRRLKKVLSQQDRVVGRRRVGRLMPNWLVRHGEDLKRRQTPSMTNRLLKITWAGNLRHISPIEFMWVTSLTLIPKKVGYIWLWPLICFPGKSSVGLWLNICGLSW